MKSLRAVCVAHPVPEGQSKVARQFIAGFKTKNPPRPIGTLEFPLVPKLHLGTPVLRQFHCRSFSPTHLVVKPACPLQPPVQIGSGPLVPNLQHPEEGKRNASLSRSRAKNLRHPERGEGSASFSRGGESSRVEGPTRLHRKCPQRINLASNQTTPPARREPEFPLVPNLRHREQGERNASPSRVLIKNLRHPEEDERNASYSRGWVRNLRHPSPAAAASRALSEVEGGGEGNASFSRGVRSSRVEGPTGLHRKCPQRIKLSLKPNNPAGRSRTRSSPRPQVARGSALVPALPPPSAQAGGLPVH